MSTITTRNWGAAVAEAESESREGVGIRLPADVHEFLDSSLGGVVSKVKAATATFRWVRDLNEPAWMDLVVFPFRAEDIKRAATRKVIMAIAKQSLSAKEASAISDAMGSD